MNVLPNVTKDQPLPLYTPIENCLNMIQKVEDMVSTFQAYNHPQTARPKKKLPEKEKPKEFFVIPQLKKAVEVLKKRITESSPIPINIPNFRRFKQSLPTENLIGPGSYLCTPMKVQQEHDFVMIPRLNDRVIHKLCTMKARRKSLTFEESSKLTIFDSPLPITRIDIRKRAKLHNEKIELVKEVGKEIKDYYHEIKKNHLDQKLQRIKWLENKEEIISLKQTWRKLISQISIASLLHLKIKNYKNIRKRSRFFYSILYLTNKFLGKMRKTLTRRRKKVIYKVMNIQNVAPFSQPAIGWVIKKRSLFTEIIASTTENINSTSQLHNLMYKWKISLRHISKSIISFYKIHQARKKALSLLCKKCALESKTNSEYQDFAKIQSLPYLTRDHLISTYIKEKLITYANSITSLKRYQRQGTGKNFNIKLNGNLYRQFTTSSKKSDTSDIKFSLFREPLVLKSHLMRILSGKTKKTIRFKFN